MKNNNEVWIWIFVAGVLFFLFGSFGMGGYGMMGLGMGFGFIFMLLFWGMLIWLVLTLANAAQPSREKEDSSTILKKRYASGEISRKQYEEIKKELR